jgi:hypothetical protein
VKFNSDRRWNAREPNEKTTHLLICETELKIKTKAMMPSETSKDP